MIGDYMLDPPDEPPFEECPDCGGTGVDDDGTPCAPCDGDGERYITQEELDDAAAEAAIEKAEARRDDW